MEGLSFEEENIIKGIKKFFQTRKKNKADKDRILSDIKTLFVHENDQVNYYKPLRVRNFWSNNCIEYESNSERNKTLSVEKYLNKIRPYLKKHHQ